MAKFNSWTPQDFYGHDEVVRRDFTEDPRIPMHYMTSAPDSVDVLLETSLSLEPREFMSDCLSSMIGQEMILGTTDTPKEEGAQ